MEGFGVASLCREGEARRDESFIPSCSELELTVGAMFGSVGMLNWDGSCPVAFISACNSFVSSWNCLISSSMDGPAGAFVIALCVVG